MHFGLTPSLLNGHKNENKNISCSTLQFHNIYSVTEHKPSLKFRYVVSYANCSIKPLAIKVTFALKAIYSTISRYSNMLFKVTGVNRNWIIQNNQPILDTLNYINDNTVARNIQTYDFSTLYTNLDHNDIKIALRFVIKLAFRNNRIFNYISIYKNGYRWVKDHKRDTFVFDEDKLIKCVDFLIDNCYFVIGESVFKQLIGVPIGIDAGPYIANLTLWYYENKFIDSTYKSKYFIVKKLNYTYRLIDDISSINSDGYFEQYFREIYPDSLTLNKENSGDLNANVLDLNISIINDKFCCQVFDKRDNFNFNIIQYQPLSSNQASNIKYGVFSSQVVRYSRICSDLSYFSERVDRIFKDFIDLGYKRERLCTLYQRIVLKYNLSAKFGDGCRKILH